jgi:hypothetical protein
VQRRRIQDWAQQILDLKAQPAEPLVNRDTAGLIEAVAALLLAAVGVAQTVQSIEIGGADEQQDHA